MRYIRAAGDAVSDNSPGGVACDRKGGAVTWVKCLRWCSIANARTVRIASGRIQTNLLNSYETATSASIDPSKNRVGRLIEQRVQINIPTKRTEREKEKKIINYPVSCKIILRISLCYTATLNYNNNLLKIL
jgi:hypothetical protein